jgi:mRNA-degrading endonuclease RelE of RelBE toxin-antitoxin system
VVSELIELRAPKMSSRYFDQIEMQPNYPYSSSFQTNTRRAKKLKGYQYFYRIKIGDYPIGVAIINTEEKFIDFFPNQIYKIVHSLDKPDSFDSGFIKNPTVKSAD